MLIEINQYKADKVIEDIAHRYDVTDPDCDLQEKERVSARRSMTSLESE